MGAVDRRVHSLLGLGIPVILDSASMDQTKYMTRGQLEDISETYLRKLIDKKAWRRFLSLKSDYRLILRVVLTFVSQKAGNSHTSHRGTEISATTGNRTGNNFNTYFPLALHNMISSRKVLLIFSGADRLHWEFEEKYIQKYSQEFQKFRNNIDVHVIENANHILSFTEWQNEMLGKFASALKSVDTCG